MLNTILDPSDSNLVMEWCKWRCVHVGNLIRSGIVLLDDWVAIWESFGGSRMCRKFWELPRIWCTAWRRILAVKRQSRTNSFVLVVLCVCWENLLGGLSGS